MTARMAIVSTITAILLAGGGQAATLPGGWTSQGNAGTGSANGDVTAAPDGSLGYFYASTAGGVDGAGSLAGVGGTGSATNGSAFTTSGFSAMAGDALQFFFNYVSSDGGALSDYGWGRVLDGAGDQVDVLFTARTNSGGNSVPGLQTPAGSAVLEPATAAMQGSTMWNELGIWSGACADAGCGHTGWVKATYTFATAGIYSLQFGVTNWAAFDDGDTFFDSGLAIAAPSVVTPQPSQVPLPATAWLLLAGLGATRLLRRRNP